MHKPRVAAIITARAGSKRLRDKNILPLGGIPLLGWSTHAAAGYGAFVEIIISSDSRHYCDIGLQQGATTALLRSEALSSDTATSFEVVEDILHRTGGDRQWDAFALLQPTSPLRTVADVSAAMRLFETSLPEAVVSVCPTECPIEWTGRLDPDGGMSAFAANAKSNRRAQDSVPSYRLNGAIYIVRIDAFLAQRSFVPAGSIPYIMSRETSVDIDTELDYAFAELILRRDRGAPT